MKVVARVWATDGGSAFLRDEDGSLMILADERLFAELVKPTDVREGDELTLEVSLTRRTRPERTA